MMRARRIVARFPAGQVFLWVIVALAYIFLHAPTVVVMGASLDQKEKVLERGVGKADMVEVVLDAEKMAHNIHVARGLYSANAHNTHDVRTVYLDPNNRAHHVDSDHDHGLVEQQSRVHTAQKPISELRC